MFDRFKIHPNGNKWTKWNYFCGAQIKLIIVVLEFYKKKRFWKRLLLITVIVPLILFSIVLGIVYSKQDAIVQEMIRTVNDDFVGTLKIKDSHIAPFANFPYISVDLENVEVFEGKKPRKKNKEDYLETN